MPEITMEQAVAVGEQIKSLVANLNAIEEQDLEALIEEGRVREALDPLVDPTGWRDGQSGMNRQASKVLVAILEFKRTVKGIGNFR